MNGYQKEEKLIKELILNLKLCKDSFTDKEGERYSTLKSHLRTEMGRRDHTISEVQQWCSLHFKTYNQLDKPNLKGEYVVSENTYVRLSFYLEESVEFLKKFPVSREKLYSQLKEKYDLIYLSEEDIIRYYDDFYKLIISDKKYQPILSAQTINQIK